jgi:hypothetical protein
MASRRLLAHSVTRATAVPGALRVLVSVTTLPFSTGTEPAGSFSPIGCCGVKAGHTASPNGLGGSQNFA